MPNNRKYGQNWYPGNFYIPKLLTFGKNLWHICIQRASSCTRRFQVLLMAFTLYKTSWPSINTHSARDKARNKVTLDTNRAKRTEISGYYACRKLCCTRKEAIYLEKKPVVVKPFFNSYLIFGTVVRRRRTLCRVGLPPPLASMPRAALHYFDCWPDIEVTYRKIGYLNITGVLIGLSRLNFFPTKLTAGIGMAEEGFWNPNTCR